MKIFCYNKGTKERNEQKMFQSFKFRRGYTNAQIETADRGWQKCRRDAAKKTTRRRVRKAMIPTHEEAEA